MLLIAKFLSQNVSSFPPLRGEGGNYWQNYLEVSFIKSYNLIIILIILQLVSSQFPYLFPGNFESEFPSKFPYGNQQNGNPTSPVTVNHKNEKRWITIWLNTAQAVKGPNQFLTF
jgi:hypothetical protein